MLKISNIAPLAILCSLVAISLTSNVSASAIFDGTGLDQDGTFHVNMAPPKNMNEKYLLSEMISDLTQSFGITSGGEWNCNDDFTSCRLVNGSEWTDESYGITYIYNPTVDAIIDELIDNSTFPDDGFFVSDLDLIKYLYQSGISSNQPLLPAFSSELKNFLGNKNLTLDIRMGGDDPFMDFQGGMPEVFYDGVLYNVYDANVMIYAPRIFYVEDGTTDYVAALKTRLTNTFGEGILEMVSVEEDDSGTTIREAYDLDCQNDQYCTDPSTSYESYSYFQDYLDEKLYYVCAYAEFDGHKMGICYNATIVADSSKITSASTVNSTDLLTGVNISSTSTMLPGDAITYAESLGNGNEDIKNLLGSDKFALYELGLRSASLEEEVSDNDDGFTVSIPIPDNLSGITNLSAYWLNATTGKLEEHPAEISADGKIATYETNHFSSYFLAESSTSTPIVPNTGANSNEKSNEASISILSSIVTAIGLAGFALYRKIKRLS